MLCFQDPIVPTILYVILGYLIGRLFLTVFGLACDTSLQCFIMSEDGMVTTVTKI